MTAAEHMRWRVGDVVRQLRRSRGWEQAELHARSGVHAVTISNIETGKSTKTRPDTFEKLADAFGLSLAEFYALVDAIDQGEEGPATPGPVPPAEQDTATMNVHDLRRLETMLTLLPEDAADEILRAATKEAVRRLAAEELGESSVGTKKGAAS